MWLWMYQEKDKINKKFATRSGGPNASISYPEVSCDVDHLAVGLQFELVASRLPSQPHNHHHLPAGGYTEISSIFADL